MQTPEDARHTILDLLEPGLPPIQGELSTHQLDRMVAYSQAISLRRIADALSSPDGLNEVLTCAVSNLSNALAEHRMYSK